MTPNDTARQVAELELAMLTNLVSHGDWGAVALVAGLWTRYEPNMGAGALCWWRCAGACYIPLGGKAMMRWTWMVFATGLVLGCSGQKKEPRRSAKPTKARDSTPRVVSAKPIAAPIKAPPKAERPKLDPKAVKVLQLTLEDDMMGWVEGKDTMVNWGRRTSIHQVADAPGVSKLFRSNVVAGEAKYKGKTVLLKGTIDAVRKDLSGRVHLILKGHSAFQNVRAYLGNSMLARAAELKKGEKVLMVCRGSAPVLNSPVFDKCEDSKPVIARLKRELASDIKAWERGAMLDLKISKSRAKAVVGLYYFFTKLRPDSPCRKKMDKACESDLKKLGKKIRKEMVKPTAETKERLKRLLTTVAHTPDKPGAE